MKSPEEIMKGLILCSDIITRCSECPYDDAERCREDMMIDAAERINQLEPQLAAAPKWRKYPEEKPAADGLYYVYYGDNHKDKAMICNFNTEYGYFGMYVYDFDKKKADFIEEKDIAMWMEVPKEMIK